MNYFYSFNNRYFIEAEILMENSFHIGKGTSFDPIGTDLPVIKTADGLPYIPGSSIKGIIRTQLEKILRTFDMQGKKIDNKKGACDIFGQECISNEEEKKLIEENTKNGEFDEENFLKQLSEKLCITCSLFGSTKIASRIYVKDAFLLDPNIEIKTEIKDGVAIDRDTGTAKNKFKYDYEVVPAGTKFSLHVILENVEDWEVGLLGLIFNLWKRGEIAIGGKNSTGLGWSKLENINIYYVNKKTFLDYLLDDKKIKCNLKSYIKTLQEKIK
ncbi:MAG: type III CRISPR-associated RAMP protein Csx7 [Promethearchaeota archaeon]